MKKFLISALVMLTFCFSANAQIVVANNYDSPISGMTDAQEDDDLEFGIVGLGYYSFDGFDNWGATFGRINPNGFGGEMSIRMNFEDHGNYNADLGVNYSFQLLNSENAKVFITLAAGPSLRTQDQYDYEENSWETSKFFFDAYVNARLAARFNKIYISGGYFLWAPKFKFGGDYKADGFNISVAYAL